MVTVRSRHWPRPSRAPEALSTDLGVLGTNLILTVIVLLTFGLTSSLFNSTIKSNRDQIDAWTAAALAGSDPCSRLRVPFRGAPAGCRRAR